MCSSWFYVVIRVMVGRFVIVVIVVLFGLFVMFALFVICVMCVRCVLFALVDIVARAVIFDLCVLLVLF